MLIENVALTMSHLGLGRLNEYALMVLFGNAHSNHLVLGRENTPDEIRDHDGLLLYPAYFYTHLQVPKPALLNYFPAWRRYSVGVEVSRFGETLLNSDYIFAPEGQIGEDRAGWDQDRWPSMHGNNLIVVDASEETSSRRVSVPRADVIAELAKIKRPPAAIIKAKKIRAKGFDPAFQANISSQAPLSYFVAPDRDAAPGHAMIFANFSRVMDIAEFQLLNQRRADGPGLAVNILQHFALLDREIYYFGNCFAGDMLEVHYRGHLQTCPADTHGDEMSIISVARLDAHVEVVRARDQSLWAMARVIKLLAPPTHFQDLIPDVKRIVSKLPKINPA